jgi:hypothetical protein
LTQPHCTTMDSVGEAGREVECQMMSSLPLLRE